MISEEMYAVHLCVRDKLLVVKYFRTVENDQEVLQTMPFADVGKTLTYVWEHAETAGFKPRLMPEGQEFDPASEDDRKRLQKIIEDRILGN